MARRWLIRLPPPTRGPLALVVLAALVVVLATPQVAVQTAERPAYLATALTRDGRDQNVQVFKGRAVTTAVRYDAGGHAELPAWTAKPAVVPGVAVPWAPRMGWSVDAYMEPVARGERPLRYCADRLRAFDAQTGDHTTTLATEALVAKFRGPFNTGRSFAIPTPVEDCTTPDVVLHADADSTTIGCSGEGTLACAALQFEDSRPVTYVSFGGPLRRRGELPDRCIISAVHHESGHAGDLGHSGHYGDEGRHHPHPSDMGWMAGCYPEDNPSDRPAIEDWLTVDGHAFTWGFQPQATATPVPTPHPIDPLSWQLGFQAGFNTGYNPGFQAGYCAALPSHPGCPP